MENVIRKRAAYLTEISSFVNVPVLKSYYRTERNAILIDEGEPIPQVNRRVCGKCLLDATETSLLHMVKPEQHKSLLKKYAKKCTYNKTNYQKKQSKGLNKYKQAIMLKCSTCTNEVKISVRSEKPQTGKNTKYGKVRDNTILMSKSQKRKRKQWNDFAGIKASAVAEAKQQLIVPEETTNKKRKVAVEDNTISKDNTSTEAKGKQKQQVKLIVPAEKSIKKRKLNVEDRKGGIKTIAGEKVKQKFARISNETVIDLDETPDVIVLEDTPIQKSMVQCEEDVIVLDHPQVIKKKKKKKKKKVKGTSQTVPAVSRRHANNNVSMNNNVETKETRIITIKKQVNEINQARNNLGSLSSKKEKKKLKLQLRKLQDSLRNIERLKQKPKSGLKDFLSTIV